MYTSSNRGKISYVNVRRVKRYNICMFSHIYIYSKTPLLRPPLGLGENGLYSGVVLRLSKDKDKINEMGL